MKIFPSSSPWSPCVSDAFKPTNTYLSFNLVQRSSSLKILISSTFFEISEVGSAHIAQLEQCPYLTYNSYPRIFISIYYIKVDHNRYIKFINIVKLIFLIFHVLEWCWLFSVKSCLLFFKIINCILFFLWLNSDLSVSIFEIKSS